MNTKKNSVFGHFSHSATLTMIFSLEIPEIVGTIILQNAACLIFKVQYEPFVTSYVFLNVASERFKETIDYMIYLAYSLQICEIPSSKSLSRTFMALRTLTNSYFYKF